TEGGAVQAVAVDLHVEGFLHVVNRALRLHVEVVLGHFDRRELVGLQEVLHRLYFLLRGRELRFEMVLCRNDGAGWVRSENRLLERAEGGVTFPAPWRQP